jgi:hypothetical protein
MEGSLMAFKVFTNGSVLQASEVNDNLMRQAVSTFSNAAARTAAITAPSEGMLTYLEDVDRYDHWNGSAWTSPFGLTLVGRQTIGTSVSSVVVSNVFSSAYDNYKVLLSGGAGSTQTAINMTLGSTVTGYRWGQTDRVFSDGSLSGAASNGDTKIPVGILNTNRLYVNLDISSPFETKTTLFQSSLITTSSAGMWAGYLNDNTSYTGFTLTAATGTMTGGTIFVYGYRKA